MFHDQVINPEELKRSLCDVIGKTTEAWLSGIQ